jgi:hypothetical protein
MPTILDEGPVVWWTLHTVASNFPENPTEDHRKEMVKLFESLWVALICGFCSTHWKIYTIENPVYPATESREKLEEYVYKAHKSVNDRKGRPTLETLEQVREVFRSPEPWKEFGGYPIKSRIQTSQTSDDKSAPKAIAQKNTTIVFIVVIAIAVTAALVSIISFAIYSSLLKKSALRQRSK